MPDTTIDCDLQAVSELVSEAEAAAAAIQAIRAPQGAAGDTEGGGRTVGNVAASPAAVEVPWKWDILRPARLSSVGP